MSDLILPKPDLELTFPLVLVMKNRRVKYILNRCIM